jgi:hypothetical protein
MLFFTISPIIANYRFSSKVVYIHRLEFKSTRPRLQTGDLGIVVTCPTSRPGFENDQGFFDRKSDCFEFKTQDSLTRNRDCWN